MGHNVLTISDRDIISNYKSIKDIKGINALNSKIISSFNNFNPDLIVMGHADNIDTNTLEILKEKKIFKNSSMVFGSVQNMARLFE